MSTKADIKTTVKSLELYKAELEKVKERYEKKRVKELEKIIVKNEELENMTEEELQDMYGYGMITSATYNKKREELRAYKSNKEALKDAPTAITEVIRMISHDIWSITQEIKSLKEFA
jgi:DNA gyrase/topoisomerase IV subunit A